MRKLMRNQLNKIIFREEGESLVEVLASFVLITLIITTFLTSFTQSAKVNQRVSLTNQATYIAQEELEKLNRYKTYTEVAEYAQENQTKAPFEVEIQLGESKKEDSGIYPVIVTVAKGGKTYAKMENNIPLQKEVTPPAP